MDRMMINLCSQNLRESAMFYRTLFKLSPSFESDWFIQLTDDEKKMEIGIIQSDHHLIPQAYQSRPNGFYLTFVVDDVEQTYQIAVDRGLEILEAPQNMFYGQRRMLIKAPEGTLIDVSSLI